MPISVIAETDDQDIEQDPQGRLQAKIQGRMALIQSEDPLH